MSENEKRLSWFVRLVAISFILPYAAIFLASVMPAGFIILIPFVALGIWSEWPKWQDAWATRKFRKELDRGLPSSEDRSSV